MFNAAELGDYEDNTDVMNVIEKLPLFPQDAVHHMDKIVQEYKTLRSVITPCQLLLDACVQ